MAVAVAVAVAEQDIQSLLLLSLSFTMPCLTMAQPLLTFTNLNLTNNPLISLAVSVFLCFFLPLTFISAILLLILHVAIPTSAYLRHFTQATRALTFSAVFLGVALTVTCVPSAAVVLDKVKVAIFVVAALVIAQVAIVRSSFNSINHLLTTGFAPVLFGLCSSAAMLFLVDQCPSFSYPTHIHGLGSKLYHLLLFCNFTLAMAVLFLRVCIATGTAQGLISVGMIERLAKVTVAISFTVILIDVYLMVAIHVGTGSEDKMLSR